MAPAWSLVALSVPPLAVMDPMVTEESVGATLHTVSVVLVQVVFTPAAHVEAHGEHGAFPEEDQVDPAAQGTGQVSEAQSLKPRV
jgi:hypothetical protein